MKIDLPPRRALPEDVKERMRPDVGQVRDRRLTPLAVAAGVVLLVLGGVVLTRPTSYEVDPGHEAVVAPSERDVTRCRDALRDPAWSSTKMVVFGLRKVLIGADGRFCELTKTRATVASTEFVPVALGTGRMTYRTGQVIAGVPPKGARTAKAREVGPSHSRASSDSVVTPEFFIVYSQGSMGASELVFDDTTVQIPKFSAWSADGESDNYESGDANPRSRVNLLARCADNAFANSAKPEDLTDWEPLLMTDPAQSLGMLVAHRGHGEWATCSLGEYTGALSTIRTAYQSTKSTAYFLAGYQAENQFVMVGRTQYTAKTAEVSDSGGAPVTTEVADGHFIVTLPFAAGTTLNPATLRVVARDAAGAVVYDGGVK
ncbi:hypothetical protein [Lentzea sp. NBRC 102530]|uniref:hypothetical protein n=1 Tax=Lentzea sp. NBRC 102530 TaxID=3032201 RepID=UPI0024A197C3|nr:hypothetical protein [Lentzea sp. NBRC 102530]GLY51719.1 hypothetical protein Lesp01_53750 [Lentzea sp. NBRC 102530]